MTPQFLRSEAARFREMSGTASREASRDRLLGMAADFEARADAADAQAEPAPRPAVKLKPGKPAAGEP